MVTQLTMGLCFPVQATSSMGMFAFGQFDNLFDGRSNYHVYELPLFVAMGCLGGVFGALFNYTNQTVSKYRITHINSNKWTRMKELLLITVTMSLLSFILPLCWPVCTPIDQQVAYTKQENDLLDHLVQFTCPSGRYNQLASLYFTSDDMAMRQLFHFREVDGEGLNSLTSGPLILYFVPYFFMAAITAGSMCPAGLFVPTLLSGAAYGRLIGHWMNLLFPGHVGDAGTYALIGAASILGGNARMTIAGCVIVLEACGNITYLLPLMLTFAACRYTGNAINEPMYDMQIHLKSIPFLEDSLHSLGMLNYHPISKIMTTDVTAIQEVEKVSKVMELLHTTNHNGFPVVNREGKLRGFILRKTLCTLLKLKAYSTPVLQDAADPAVPTTLSSGRPRGQSAAFSGQNYARSAEGGIILAPASLVSYDTIERPYPNYPDIDAVKLSDRELVSPLPALSLPLPLLSPNRIPLPPSLLPSPFCPAQMYWLDVRAHMDTAPIALNETASLKRAYT